MKYTLVKNTVKIMKSITIPYRKYSYDKKEILEIREYQYHVKLNLQSLIVNVLEASFKQWKQILYSQQFLLKWHIKQIGKSVRVCVRTIYWVEYGLYFSSHTQKFDNHFSPSWQGSAECSARSSPLPSGSKL